MRRKFFWIILILILGVTVSPAEEKTKRPVIGISAPSVGQEISLDSAYVEAIQQSGGVPLLLPMTESNERVAEMIDLIDGLVLTGGEDLDPALYNEPPHQYLETVHHERDRFDILLLKTAVSRRLPILGICRGHQLINVYFGGSLYQDLRSQKKEAILHRQQNVNQNYPWHDAEIDKNSRLYQIMGTSKIRVNSIHHQAVKIMVNDFKPAARSSDGVIEAIESDKYPMILSVQWHPEKLLKIGDENSKKLFIAFVGNAQTYADKKKSETDPKAQAGR